MDLKSLVVLAITVYYVISVNDTLTKTFDEIWCKSFRKIFGVEGERITQHLSVEDLENLTIGIAMDTVADAVNLQLNRRSRILHYRDGKINPPFLTNFLKCKSRRNEAHEDASEYCWSEYTAILFGEENPIHAINASCYFNIFLITSHKDHLKFFITKTKKFVPKEIKGNSMNGVIFPRLHISRFLAIHLYTHKILSFQSKYNENWNAIDDETKLIIMIVNNNEIISGRIENRISMKTEILRKKVRISAPICIVGQSDIRDEDIKKLEGILDSLMIVFHGSDTEIATFVVNTKKERILRKKFKNWMQKKLNFLNSHQVIAFHFTMINGTEPENSEEIFSNAFENIPLTTLRLIGEPSVVGVNYQDKTKSYFKAGPVYAFIGIRKFNF